jgi:hypothetical protein
MPMEITFMDNGGKYNVYYVNLQIIRIQIYEVGPMNLYNLRIHVYEVIPTNSLSIQIHICKFVQISAFFLGLA